MPANRKTMRKIKEVIRLKFEADLSHERIAAATGVSKGAVTKYLQRAREAELGWPLPAALDDAQLEALLFPRAPPLVTRHAEPDFAHLHQELKRKGVTLQLPDWIASHVRCFEAIGCVAALLVPDNLKSAINHACRYEPEANSTYGELAAHYATAILPARPYRPRDKTWASYCTSCS